MKPLQAMIPDGRKNPAVVVAGPTCSGKSALALDLAERIGGTIVNADSMQVYRELRVLTARPTPQDEARAPHVLYGVRPAAEAASVAWWREWALAEMQAVSQAGRVPILCGGTGLYLGSLSGGLAEIPDPGAAAREEARALLARDGAAVLHAMLARDDPDTAAGLRPSDGQRVARAWEVWRGTGEGLHAWRARQPSQTPVPLRVILLDPPRASLRQAIATRFDAMLADGALAEIDALLALRLESALPAMRAHGVPELSAFRRGEISLDDAADRTRIVTGQYTKRQATWFRHRSIAAASDTHRFLARYIQGTQESESILAFALQFIRPLG